MFDSNPFNHPKCVVEKANEKWMLEDSKIYLLRQKDTLVYYIKKNGSNASIREIYDAENGIWAIANDDIYLIDQKGGVRYAVKESLRTNKFCCNSNKELVAITKTGLLKYSSKGVELVDKQNSAQYQSFVKGIDKCYLPHFYSGYYRYRDYIVAANKDSSAVYFLSDKSDYMLKLNFSKMIGVDTKGNIWYTSYRSDEKSYYLNYIENGWEEKLRNNQQPVLVAASNFTASLGNDCDLDYSNTILANNNSIYIITYYGGIVKYENGTYKTLPGVDGSSFKTIYKLLELNKNDYLYNLPIKLWSDKVWSKSVTGKTGIGYNFYNTNKDSQGNRWKVENGELINETQDTKRNIKAALDSVKQKEVEEYKMNSFWLLNRIYVNKKDVIHMFGKHSVVTYDIVSKRWRLYPTSKNGDIDYQKIYQDHIGNIWFQIQEDGIYYFDRSKVNRLNLPFKDIAYWQIDDDNNLMLIANDVLYWYKIAGMQNGKMSLVRKISLDYSIYSLNRIKTIITNNKHVIVVNSEGFYLFD
ncbi:hypothetical protein CLV25_11034 [Acetobacteroides hydrogenigenes]|uniref:Two component regulator with propeller domain n=2 Tax=Acetobacteroides hydrogenigenes TaxID=979970 RepID=A0A4R2ECG0_9BACT|nr:hypothetical protein CLV25_11034 [Acetobacteroides hydrogenigenes]